MADGAHLSTIKSETAGTWTAQQVGEACVLHAHQIGGPHESFTRRTHKLRAMLRAPPRFPRALFIAAFAVAAVPMPERRRRADFRDGPHVLTQRRNQSLAVDVRLFGGAVIAAGRAGKRFIDEGGLSDRATRRAIAPPIDPLAAAIIDCPVVAIAIGKPRLADNQEAPWVTVDRGTGRPAIRIYWRGEVMHGERVVTGRQAGELTGLSRAISPDRMKDAADAAAKALLAAGHRVAPFRETKRVKTPTFDGLMTTIVVIASHRDPLARFETPAISR